MDFTENSLSDPSDDVGHATQRNLDPFAGIRYGPMERLSSIVLLCLVVAVLGVGLILYRAAEQAEEDRAELVCLQRAETTATIVMLAPSQSVDPQGRLEAMGALGKKVDAC